ncbi:MAG: SGNH/GDSL hydrolase family protein [Deltaproteobacteria bacterium]|nr:MAG: SGNH/GDSL hydrolase family protein [Deltaproteobacteria bacterium]
MGLINRHNQVNAVYFTRHITLRERPPLLSSYIRPTKEDLEISDTLQDKRYRYRIDKDGFVVPSAIYHKPDKSLVFLGGSAVECIFVEEENRFPYLAGRLLEKKSGLKINSYNGGHGGNNSMHSLFILLSKVIPLKPSIVVIMHNINDLVILLYEKTYYNHNPHKEIIVTENYGVLRLARMFGKKMFPNLYQAGSQLVDIPRYLNIMEFGDEFAHIRGTKVTADKEKIISDFRKNLQLFIEICRTQKIIPVLMTMQNRLKQVPDAVTLKEFRRLSSDLSYEEFKNLFDAMNGAIRSQGRENGVMVIDLAREIPQEKEFIYDMVHLNDTGCKKVAKIISNGLERLIVNPN